MTKMIVDFIDLKTGFAAGLLPYQIIQIRNKIVTLVTSDDETVKVVIPSNRMQNEIVTVPIDFCTRLPECGEQYFNPNDSSERIIAISVSNTDEEAVFDGIIPVVTFTLNSHLRTLEIREFLKRYAFEPSQS